MTGYVLLTEHFGEGTWQITFHEVFHGPRLLPTCGSAIPQGLGVPSWSLCMDLVWPADGGGQREGGSGGREGHGRFLWARGRSALHSFAHIPLVRTRLMRTANCKGDWEMWSSWV